MSFHSARYVSQMSKPVVNYQMHSPADLFYLFLTIRTAKLRLFGIFLVIILYVYLLVVLLNIENMQCMITFGSRLRLMII